MQSTDASLIERARAFLSRVRMPLYRVMIISIGVWSLGGLIWIAARENNPWEAYVINANLAEPAVYLGADSRIESCEGRAIRYRLEELTAGRSIVGIEDVCVRRCWPIERGRVTVFDRECTVSGTRETSAAQE